MQVVVDNGSTAEESDLEYDPEDFRKILAQMLAGKSDVVIRSRFQGSHAHRIFFFWPSVGNKTLTLVYNSRKSILGLTPNQLERLQVAVGELLSVPCIALLSADHFLSDAEASNGTAAYSLSHS